MMAHEDHEKNRAALNEMGPVHYRYREEPDYCDTDYIIKSEPVEWQRELSDMVNALVKTGLRIGIMNKFDKSAYPHNKEWCEKDGFYHPAGGPPRYPLMFSLRATKP